MGRGRRQGAELSYETGAEAQGAVVRYQFSHAYALVGCARRLHTIAHRRDGVRIAVLSSQARDEVELARRLDLYANGEWCELKCTTLTMRGATGANHLIVHPLRAQIDRGVGGSLGRVDLHHEPADTALTIRAVRNRIIIGATIGAFYCERYGQRTSHRARRHATGRLPHSLLTLGQL